MIYIKLNNNLETLHNFLKRLLKNEYNMTYYKKSKLHIDEELGTIIQYQDGWKFIYMYLDDDILNVSVYRTKEELGKHYTVNIKCLDFYYNEDEKTYVHPDK